MAVLNVNTTKCNLCGICIKTCPFNSIELTGESIRINDSCRMCRMCIKNCSQNAIILIDNEKKIVNKKDWKGILVFAEYNEGTIHPVTFELIGIARKLGQKISQPVYCVLIGSKIRQNAFSIIDYGIEKLFVYDNEQLEYFRVDVFANAFEDCIRNVKPSIVLIGGTPIGRSLAPRLSVRFRTGLTADCTILDVRPNSDLVQIRPAFGGNIMAQIVTPNTRPQFATVRYKVMDQAQIVTNPTGTIEKCYLDEALLKSHINIKGVIRKEKQPDISNAEVLIVGGRGIKDKKDFDMLNDLASLLGGQLASTRPLVEAGWMPYTKQIGLSGRTVKPKLIITCGVSGAIQFTAGMNSSDFIIAINNDKNASIFKFAHFGIVGNLYEVIPKLICRIKEETKII